jgi:hypothetical protein
MRRDVAEQRDPVGLDRVADEGRDGPKAGQELHAAQAEVSAIAEHGASLLRVG